MTVFFLTEAFLSAFGLAASKGAIQGNVSSVKAQSKIPATHAAETLNESKLTAHDEVGGEPGGSTQPTLGKVQAELQVQLFDVMMKSIHSKMDTKNVWN